MHPRKLIRCNSVLLAPDFEHSCLNRLQLRNTLEMVDLADQAQSLQLVGRLANPLHGR